MGATHSPSGYQLHTHQTEVVLQNASVEGNQVTDYSECKIICKKRGNGAVQSMIVFHLLEQFNLC